MLTSRTAASDNNTTKI